MSPTGRSALTGAVALLVSMLHVLPLRGEDPARRRDSPEKGKPDSYALLVAVQDYDNALFRPLEYTKNDIEDLYQVLLQSGFPKDNIVVMHDGRPRRFLPEAAKIRAELRALLARADKGDTLVVALSGHGVQFKAAAKGKEETPYFCPADAKLADRRSLIGLDELYGALKDCPADRKLLLVDACRNDPLAKGEKGLPNVSLDSLSGTKKMPLPKGLVAFFSCGVGEKSYEDAELKHGVFFHHLLQGWRGEAANADGEVTLERLVAYTRKETKKYTHLKRGAIQRPFLRSELEDDWVLRKLDLGQRDFALGMAALWKNNRDAFTYFNNAIRANPKFAEAYVRRGFIYYHYRNNPDRAIADYTEAIRLKPESAEAYHNRGFVYSNRKKDYDQAIADYTQAIRLEPNQFRHYEYRAAAYQGKGDYDQAIADLTKVIALNPKQGYRERGFVYYLRKDDYDRAIKDYTQAIALDVTDAYLYKLRAWAYMKKKEYDRAIADYTHGINFKPKDYGYYDDRSEAYLAKKNYERAIADCTQAIRLDPDAYHYRKRGRAYEEMKDYDKAIADFGEAIRLDPKDPYSYDLRADSYEAKAKRYRAKANRYKKARSARARPLRKKYLGRAAAAHKKAQTDLATATKLRNQK
jgi:tetratricopeptide (TPR) repeat protein